MVAGYPINTDFAPMKFLVVGLGNIGPEYAHTRHNIGFDMAEAFAAKYNAVFQSRRYADVAEIRLRGKSITLIKPTTFMNLSGKAVRYWLNELKLTPEQMLVLVDDLALPFGKIRIRGNGSDAGHNGLKNIQEILQTKEYPRLRFGIGSEYPQGRQVEFVLGAWNDEENQSLKEIFPKTVEAIECFVMQGLAKAMNLYNT